MLYRFLLDLLHKYFFSRREKFERRLPPFAFGVAAGIKTSPKGDATRTVDAEAQRRERK
ncbi:MAG: hypothetical protein RMY28_014035 [Nostoc sp. ChiSLP01]